MKAVLTSLALALLLGACRTVPLDIEKRPSQAWPDPAGTRLGALFDEYAPADAALSGMRLVPDPRVAFRARYAFAAHAERTLDMQYYLWKGDTTGRLLLYRALQAGDRGVKVRLLIDDIYHSGRDVTYATIDAHPNIEIRVFNPLGHRGAARHANFAVNKSKLNHRMHNKIFLVDNAVAILGGRNIGDDYFGIDPALNFHDLDVIAVGPVARQAGEAFDQYWNSDWAVPITALTDAELGAADLDASRTRLELSLTNDIGTIPYAVPQSFAAVEEALRELAEGLTWAPAEVVVDDVDRFNGGNDSVFVDLMRGLAANAEEEMVVQTAYLIPSAEAVETARRMVDRGVRLRVMTNSLMSNNHVSVHGHYAKYRKDMLEAGVELYELRADSALLDYYRRTDDRVADSHSGLHTKAFVVDGRVSMVGSYNMDPRSRIWNSEIGLLVHGEEFAGKVLAEMNEEFDSDNAYRLSLDENGDIVWSIDGETYTRDPDSTWWRRAMARIIGWLPIENEL